MVIDHGLSCCVGYRKLCVVVVAVPTSMRLCPVASVKTIGNLCARLLIRLRDPEHLLYLHVRWSQYNGHKDGYRHIFSPLPNLPTVTYIPLFPTGRLPA